VTSRPANSERYIICEGALETTKDIIYDYLFGINEKLNETFRKEESDLDVVQIVPLDVMTNDDHFFNYIYESNERMGKIQVLNLKKIQAFATNANWHDSRQADLITDCLKYWNIPEHTRLMYAGEQPAPVQQPNSKFQKTANPRWPKQKIVSLPANHRHLSNKFNNELRSSKLQWDLNALNFRIKELSQGILEENFKKCSIFDYKCLISCGTLVLLLGCGRQEVYELELNSSTNCFKLYTEGHQDPDKESQQQHKWQRLESLSIELPRETLLLAEKVVEFRGQDQPHNVIHVIDAFFIEGKNMIIKDKKIVSYEERHALLEVFVKSVSKRSRSDLSNIRLKDMVEFDAIENEVLDNLVKKNSAKGNRVLATKLGIHLPLSFATECYVYPCGIYFLKFIQSPWSQVASKRTGKKYFYKSEGQISTYTLPEDDWLFSNPKYYLENGFVWKWFDEKEELNIDPFSNNTEFISKQKFLEFLQDKKITVKQE
jgi:cap1 methyltransferase